jgi:hypothetical protein
VLDVLISISRLSGKERCNSVAAAHPFLMSERGLFCRFGKHTLVVVPGILLFAAAFLLAGCHQGSNAEQKSGGTATAPSAELQKLIPNQPQPKLKTIRLYIGAEELIAELALTVEQHAAGMMWRTNMAENEAMLFVFSRPHQTAFWMKNTPLPLSAAYIGADGKILEIHELQPHNTNAVASRSSEIQYVLETKSGWFDRHNIRTGAVVKTERGSLSQTFFAR